MATSGTVRGDVIGLYIGATLVAAAMSTGLDIQRDMRDANNNDSGDAKSILPGRYGWSVSGRAHFQFDAAYGYSDLKAAIKAGTRLTVAVDSAETGDEKESGYGYLTSLKATHPDHENSEYDFAIQGDGELTTTTNS